MGEDSMAVTDDEPAELTVGAVRELVERLTKLEARREQGCDRCGHEVRARAWCGTCHDLPDVDRDVVMTQADLILRQRIFELGARIQELEQAMLSTDLQTKLPDLLRQLRANGVTRYKRGDLEIELGPCDNQRQIGLGNMDAPCSSCGEGAPFHKASCPDLPPPTDAQRALDDSLDHQLERRFGGELKPNRPPDEQPAVEIDFAATEQLLREQDQKRRRASE